jgi:hypothetical protein
VIWEFEFTPVRTLGQTILSKDIMKDLGGDLIGSVTIIGDFIDARSAKIIGQLLLCSLKMIDTRGWRQLS